MGNDSTTSGERAGASTTANERRDQQQDAAATLRSVFDNSRSFIGLMTVEGVVIDANRTALAAAGVAADDVLGKPFWETQWWSHSKTLRERLKEAIRRASAGVGDRFEATHPVGDGMLIDVDFSLSPVFDEQGKVIYLIPEGRDVTHEKQRERELARYMSQLKEANVELEQFAYVASHDLRSPLRGIGQLAAWIREDESEQLSEQGNEMLRKLEGRVARLEGLLTDLLAYSRAGRWQGEPTQVDLKETIEDVLNLLEIPAEFTVVVDPEMPKLWTHATPLSQVFLNLINNAIKHHDKSAGTIRVAATALAESVELRVQDDGPGIDPRHHERIFGMFQTLKPHDASGGSGMGLSIIKKLVLRLGGEIRVESTLGCGATFIVVLPKTRGADGPARGSADDGAETP